MSEEVIQELDYSLMLVKPDKWEVVEKVYEDRVNPQHRMVFSYNGFTKELPIISEEDLITPIRQTHDAKSPKKKRLA